MIYLFLFKHPCLGNFVPLHTNLQDSQLVSKSLENVEVAMNGNGTGKSTSDKARVDVGPEVNVQNQVRLLCHDCGVICISSWPRPWRSPDIRVEIATSVPSE